MIRTKKTHPADAHNANIITNAEHFVAFINIDGDRRRHSAKTIEGAREKAEMFARVYKRPAMIYAVNAAGRDTYVETVNPTKETPVTTTEVETAASPKVFPKRFNAQRAARSALGKDAAEGREFRTVKVGGGYVWERIEKVEPVQVVVTPEIAAKVEAIRAKRVQRRAAEIEAIEAQLVATVTPRPVSKRSAIEEAAHGGVLPSAPDFSAPTHTRFRKKLADVVVLAEAGDLEGLKAFHINPNSTSPKAIDRYRNLCVIALEARIMNRAGDAAAEYAQETGVNYSDALVACNMD